MVDPIAEVIKLVQPKASDSNLMIGAGRWEIDRIQSDEPHFCAVIEGAVCLTVDGSTPVILRKGEYALIPTAVGFAISHMEHASDDSYRSTAATYEGVTLVGHPKDPVNAKFFIGPIVCDGADPSLVNSLIPNLVRIRDRGGVGQIVKLIGQEMEHTRLARHIIIPRLLDIILLDGLRSSSGKTSSPGLFCGLSDDHLRPAILRIHEKPAHMWSIVELARQASLSRSIFFVRFVAAMGVAPMAYLLSWRMSIAKDLLRQNTCSVAEVAERVGYTSASAFSVAFARFVGCPPVRYMRDEVPKSELK